jgi:DNA sulfur modification protein DndC
MSRLQESLFEGARMRLQDSIDLTAQSLLAYGDTHNHWAMSYSGGKDSSTVVTLVMHLIKTGRIQAPKSLTVFYVDTRMELFPLWVSAMGIMDQLKAEGVNVKVILPKLDERFFVYMFGRGVPPPAPHFRWCTGILKINPMMRALTEMRDQVGEKYLMLTGVRVGESAARDARIALSCSKDGAECGQGWYQQTTPENVADTLAPISHWRVCHVWDWLMFNAPEEGYPTHAIAEAYGGEEAEEINARTGCIACNVASRDTSLDQTIKLPQWQYLKPLKRLRPLYQELRKSKNRLMKDGSERYADGRLVKNIHRPGPLTMEKRLWGLAEVLQIQHEINLAARASGRPEISLINSEENARIHELIQANTWPNGWVGTELTGDVPMDRVIAEGVIQPLLTRQI